MTTPHPCRQCTTGGSMRGGQTTRPQTTHTHPETMKTKLQQELAAIAPSISIVTIWEHDQDHQDIRKDCDGFDDENPADWQAWQSEIRATAIDKGEEITGHAYLGGTWERAEDHPAQSNPEISGYENQMTVEALEELDDECCDARICKQIHAAIAYLKAESRRQYEEQRREIEAALPLCLPISA